MAHQPCVSHRAYRVNAFRGTIIVVTVWIIGSARRHGVPEDDIRHAVDHLAFMDNDADAEAEIDAVLALGPDRAGLPLELALVVGDDGDVVVVHAMRMRAKYAHLWPRSKGGQTP